MNSSGVDGLDAGEDEGRANLHLHVRADHAGFAATGYHYARAVVDVSPEAGLVGVVVRCHDDERAVAIDD